MIYIVTGATRGIGKAIADLLKERGHTVVCGHLSPREPKEGHVQCDISSSGEVEALADYIRRRFGQIDGLVSNAGVSLPSSFEDVTLADWERVIDTNLKGPFLLLQKLTPLLKDGSAVVQVGSIAAKVGGPLTPSYAASKAGADAMMRCYARFVAKRGIRVNSIAPGPVSSGMDVGPAEDFFMDRALFKRRATPQEIAQAVAFFLSEEAGFITGQTLYVDGGISLG